MRNIASHFIAVACGLTIGWLLFDHETPHSITPSPLAVPASTPSPAQSIDSFASSQSEQSLARDLQAQLYASVSKVTELAERLRHAEARSASAAALAYGFLERIAAASRDSTHPLEGLLETDAVSLGGLVNDINAFRQRYPSGAPREGTPEADAFAAEFKTVMDGISASVANPELRAVFEGRDTEAIARTKLLMLHGQLSLQPAQSAQIYSALQGYYAEGFTRSLNLSAKPSTDDTAWATQRVELAKRAAATVRSLLTPDQQRAFDSSQPNTFLWSILPDLLPGG